MLQDPGLDPSDPNPTLDKRNVYPTAPYFFLFSFQLIRLKDPGPDLQYTNVKFSTLQVFVPVSVQEGEIHESGLSRVHSPGADL